MDVFAEDETDMAAAEINLVGKLQSLLPPLRHKVRIYFVCNTVLNSFDIQFKNRK